MLYLGAKVARVDGVFVYGEPAVKVTFAGGSKVLMPLRVFIKGASK